MVPMIAEELDLHLVRRHRPQPRVRARHPQVIVQGEGAVVEKQMMVGGTGTARCRARPVRDLCRLGPPAIGQEGRTAETEKQGSYERKGAVVDAPRCQSTRLHPLNRIMLLPARFGPHYAPGRCLPAGESRQGGQTSRFHLLDRAAFYRAKGPGDTLPRPRSFALLAT